MLRYPSGALIHEGLIFLSDEPWLESNDWFNNAKSDYQEKKIIQPKFGDKSVWHQR
jgi:hypothetical protein